MSTRKLPEVTVHLYRGAPAVRLWSKYQATDQGWTLCGVRRIARGSDKRLAEASHRRPQPRGLPLLPPFDAA